MLKFKVNILKVTWFIVDPFSILFLVIFFLFALLGIWLQATLDNHMEPITFLNLVILNPKNPYILKLQLEKLGPAFLKVCSEELRDVLWRHGSVVQYIWETSYSLEPPPILFYILYSMYFLQSHHQYWHIKSSEKFCSKWTCLTLLNLRFCKIICALNFLPQLFNLCDTYWPS